MIDGQSASRPTGVAGILAAELILTASSGGVVATDLQDKGSATKASVPDNSLFPNKIRIWRAVDCHGLQRHNHLRHIQRTGRAGSIVQRSGHDHDYQRLKFWTLRGRRVTLSGEVVLAPFATPGVIVTPNAQGGYAVQLDSYGGLAINADGNSKGIDIQLPEQLDDFNLD